MAQLKKYGIFDAVNQYLNQKHEEFTQFGGYITGDITGRFIHRGKKRRQAYRHGRGRCWNG